MTREVRFEASGTWTVPAGVFYAEATCCGGGGGSGTGNSNGVAGGDTTVAFSTAVVGKGMAGLPTTTAASDVNHSCDGQANSGMSAMFAMCRSSANIWWSHLNERYARPMTGGSPVTPGDSITVTIGAGGVATGEGGSGYAVIRYEV